MGDLAIGTKIVLVWLKDARREFEEAAAAAGVD